MFDEENTLPWQESSWHDQSTAWLRTKFKHHQIELISQPTMIHSAPWSVVYRLPTNKGHYYFKALCPALIHEPRLTHQLFRWQPEIIQPVLEIEPDRGWMLMPDGGTTLRQCLGSNLTINYWKKILPAYARFQQAMIPHRQELFDLGVKDRRLSILPELASALSSDRGALCIGMPDGLTQLEYDALLNALPKLQILCDKLAQIGIPETLQHDDFHDGNIFVVQNGFRFFDWAESFIAHPFFTLVVTLRSIAYRFDLEENSPEMRELVDIYLREWLDFAALDRLYEAFDLAMVLGRINRALTWHMVVSTLPEPHRTKEANAVPGWIQLFLEKISLSA